MSTEWQQLESTVEELRADIAWRDANELGGRFIENASPQDWARLRAVIDPYRKGRKS